MAQQLFFCPASGGFYGSRTHKGAIPDGAVPLTERKHRQLLAAQGEGATIYAGDDGKPRLRWPSTNIAARRAGAIAAVKQEAGRRILAVASLTRQANDAAAMAQAALDQAVLGDTKVDFMPAIERRERIDALRARSNELEAAIAAFTPEQLDGFDAAGDAHWS
ncbi:MAG TPA: hypothetical protein VF680_01430 [Allosphingosinicella sp.]|jgi:hypothetical protein